ncbi:hypothetical protein [Jiulongibacter sediminis]|uniref:Uncharacterized protein n=1 Tax=Jiulongibacter sediminis TaxID=1605367 RepID=A0A0N8HAF4_9BACT|nr:hypothetical protein [Jiulongibacter sediminis]KPM50020.1 hypothetical protein AFM12_05575 [Jiulongibacter sediminis]TBX27048.1 hypothetical protein TK44_05580 [Jiulongibacter sediminis]
MKKEVKNTILGASILGNFFQFLGNKEKADEIERQKGVISDLEKMLREKTAESIMYQRRYFQNRRWLKELNEKFEPEEAFKEVVMNLNRLVTDFIWLENEREELESCRGQIEMKNYNMSVLSLAKLLEVLLHNVIISESSIENKFQKKVEKGKYLNFGNMIDILNSDERLRKLCNIGFLRDLKDLRNKAAHEIGEVFDDHEKHIIHSRAIAELRIIKGWQTDGLRKIRLEKVA